MTLTRDELEDSLRRSLAHHAHTIPDDVPEFAPTTTLAHSPHPRRRLAALIGAAAVVLVVAVSVALVMGRDRGGDRVGTADDGTFSSASLDRPATPEDAVPKDFIPAKIDGAAAVTFVAGSSRRVYADASTAYYAVRTTAGQICVVGVYGVDSGASSSTGCQGEREAHRSGVVVMSSGRWGASVALLVDDREAPTLRAGTSDAALEPAPGTNGLYHREWAPSAVPERWAIAFTGSDGDVVMRFRGTPSATGTPTFEPEWLRNQRGK